MFAGFISGTGSGGLASARRSGGSSQGDDPTWTEPLSAIVRGRFSLWNHDAEEFLRVPDHRDRLRRQRVGGQYVAGQIVPRIAKH